MLNYEIKKKAKNLDETIIKVSGVTQEFTIADLKNDIAYLEKTQREIEPVVKLKEAEIHNIVEHHPSVLNLSDEERTAAYLYNQAFVFVKEAKIKLKEISKQIKRSKDDLEEIKKQTGLKL